MPYSGGAARRGFTLLEMMLAMLLMVLVLSITIPFVRVQTNAVGAAASRLDALQNARYARSAIDRELRFAGGVPGQPVIVQAAPFAVTFNVDLLGRTTAGDPNATYINSAADTLLTESWWPSLALALPTATRTYPTVSYFDPNGVRSGAETISYFLKVDPSSGRTDLYTLFRRVNNRDSVAVTRNLWIPDGTDYFFEYYRSTASGAVSAISSNSLPLYWDDGVRTIDSIGVVRMRIAGLYRDVQHAVDVTKTIYHDTRLLNTALLTTRSCGSMPAAPTSVVARLDSAGLGSLVRIRTTFDKSTDETAGSADVQAYVLQRRPNAGGDWTVLDGLVANGSASYTMDDYGFLSGAWVYGVTAQDCTPANSSAGTAAAVTIP